MKTKSLKDSIWADKEFWREQREKYEQDQRELAAAAQAMFTRLAEAQKQDNTEE